MPSPFGLVWALLVTAVNVWGLLMHGQTIAKCLFRDHDCGSRHEPAAALLSLGDSVRTASDPGRGCPRREPGLCGGRRAVHLFNDATVPSRSFARTVVIVGTREWWQRKHQVDELAVS